MGKVKQLAGNKATVNGRQFATKKMTDVVQRMLKGSDFKITDVKFKMREFKNYTKILAENHAFVFEFNLMFDGTMVDLTELPRIIGFKILAAEIAKELEAEKAAKAEKTAKIKAIKPLH